MATHRKRKQRPLSGPVGRTALTFALAGAATATAFDGHAQAEPHLTPAQVRAKVDTLYRQAETAAERYNGAKEKVNAAEASLKSLREEAGRRTERLNTARDALGSIATAQYRNGGLDPAVQLMLSSKPDQFLDAASLAERTGARQAETVARIRRELAEVSTLHTQADHRLVELKRHRAELAAHKSSVQKKLDAAEKLLDRLTAAQRAAYAGQESGTPTPAARASRSASRGTVQAPTARAAQAVDFAYGALGSPYVWGATGPGSFDCSGLTQAAWRAAGVSLPRTTYTQINAGQRVGRNELAPGDLVFFYSGISHVGLYIGGGKMIHAPRPGTPVRIAPIDQMPFAGATRPI